MAIKYLSNISLEGNELQNVKIHPVGTAPSAGQGKLYYDTATNKLMANNGSSWYSVNGSLEDLTSGNTSRITIGGTAAAPTVDVVTGAIVDGGTGLATQDAIYDFVTSQVGAVPSETVTSLGLSANTLTYTDENGNDTDIDLSLYLDDTNLSRLTSGSINSSTGIATFTRSDATTFTIDMSAFLDGITVNNTLTSTSTSQGLSAAQGKVLKDLIDALPTQDTNTQLSDSDIATFGYIKDYTVTEGDVTAHQAALSITESQISDLTHITNNNQIGNGAGYIDDYTVTQADVTAHEAALTITESQISDLSHFSGAYNDLTGKPTLAPSNAEQNVQSDWNAASGDAFILNKPTLFDGAYNSLTGKPTLFDGDYNSLSSLPSLFDGAYASLTGKPTIPTNNNQLTNGNNYISGYTVTSGDVTAHEGDITITESQISDLSHFSGSYNDLTNKPTIPTVNTASTTTAGIVELATNTEAKAGTLTNRAVTPQGLSQTIDQEHTANRAVVTIGDGSATTLTATHNFGNQKCLVSVMEVATGDEVYAEIIKNTNDVSVIFASAPATNAYEVSMLKMS